MHRNLLIATFLFCLCLPAVCTAEQSNPQVLMETSLGPIVIELDARHAPKTVDNFLNYVRSGFYDGTIFHRVIKSFMIQGGGFTPEMKQKTTQSPIENEASNGLKNDTGTIAMARTSAPHSATAQFFINVKNNDFLNHTANTTRGWGYCVFGQVIKGMDVVHAIEDVKTTTKFGHGDVPTEPVVIEKVTIIKPAVESDSGAKEK